MGPMFFFGGGNLTPDCLHYWWISCSDLNMAWWPNFMRYGCQQQYFSKFSVYIYIYLLCKIILFRKKRPNMRNTKVIAFMCYKSIFFPKKENTWITLIKPIVVGAPGTKPGQFPIAICFKDNFKVNISMCVWCKLNMWHQISSSSFHLWSHLVLRRTNPVRAT